MQPINQYKEEINIKALDNTLAAIYGASSLLSAKKRYLTALDEFSNLFGTEEPVAIFRSPGRTEICGNHTDHQNGCVLAASVDLDMIAIVTRANSISIKSEGFHLLCLELDQLAKDPTEAGTSASLVRGIFSRFQQLGLQIGGFKAYIQSNVLKGSGLSSSAAYEVLIGTILSTLYNNGTISPVEIAKIGQYAENVYFEKPSGLMDQLACAVGGTIAIDFQNKEPLIEQIAFDLSAFEHELVIVDTMGDHADLTDDYEAITREMREVANYFKRDLLSQVDEETFFAEIPILQSILSHRSLLRALHFFTENKRVAAEKAALLNKDFPEFCELVMASGHSSLQFLQNGYSSLQVHQQGLVLALALTEQFLQKHGAYRLHGGGFAGTIQVFVPQKLAKEYTSYMDKIFNEPVTHRLMISPFGAIEITK